jgi:histidinol-phosphatase
MAEPVVCGCVWPAGECNTVDVRLAADMGLAVRVAEEAAAIALDLFNAGSPSHTKADGTVVTDADHAVERFVVAELRRWRPDDAVLGEEFGQAGSSNRRWIIDPIDGTANFVAGTEEWGVNIALQDGDELLLGVVAAPCIGQRWWASRSVGAFRSPLGSPTDDGERLRVSDRSHLADAVVSAWLLDEDPALPLLRALPGWEEPSNIAMMFRVPDGTLDVLVDGTPSKIWDRAPLIVLVEEAGGRYCDTCGGRNAELPGGLFTNGHVHEAIKELVWCARGVS